MLRIAQIVALLLWVATAAAQPTPTIRLEVDATEAPRKVLHARMSMPASPGPVTVVYPAWIPGEHGPTGPILNLAGLKFSAGGRSVPWRRDDVDMFAFHCTVPAGASALEVSLDFLLPAAAEGFSGGASATAQLVVLSWNQVLLYPAGSNSDRVTFQANLRLPAEWKYGTALPLARTTGGTIEFQPASLTTLVDSPVLAGSYFREIELAPNHYLDMAADSAAALEITPANYEQLKKLVAETGELYGARHYRQYHFLLTLSDNVAHFGLEHHESSDDRVPERTLVDDQLRPLEAGLLPHEMTHSWNGKYRRPAGLATPNYQEPMKGDLLWVYEGLTSYLGDVLTARSGLLTQEMNREYWAQMAAGLDNRPGRTWRPLLDTAVAAQLLYNAPSEWFAWRRAVDYYDEGVMIWLETDTTIREQTRGRKSLDDFIRRFYGGQSGAPEVKTYTFDDLVAALNEVAPYNWKSFFQERLQSTAAHAPLGGLEAAGWKLIYNDVPNEWMRLADGASKQINLSYSIGLTLKTDGAVVDIINGQAADHAGISPGMKLVAVNGRRFSQERMFDALRNRGELEFILENGDSFKTLRVNYTGGPRYPHLVREEAKPDLLGQIWKAKS